MKVGDLVRLRAGTPEERWIGTIIELHRDPIRERQDRKILWFGTGRTDWVSEKYLEVISD
jgi:hypothetical protein